MTQEQKELLLKDLCSRLPYGVKVNDDIQGDFTLIGLTNERIFTTCEVENCHNDFPIENIKPYLFPLSSMTVEHRCKVQNLLPNNCEMSFKNQKITFYDEGNIQLEQLENVFNFFNLYHFDYRGLIEKGLAIDATNLNIY